ncbi:MAG: hypothetical protein ACYC3I_17345 [Gemmataceae bacterium]
MNLRLWMLAVFLLQPLAELHADGGAVRLSERRGDYRITVFTSPTPPRAGPVDISVFVQDAVSGELVPEARIAVRVVPRAHPEAAIDRLATTTAATNKLFQAAVIELPEAGWWDAAILIGGLSVPVEVRFEMEVDEAMPRVWEIAPWLAWPLPAVLLFLVHHGLIWRKSRGSKRMKKAGPPEGVPALVTLSPNQRDTIQDAQKPTGKQEKLD